MFWLIHLSYMIVVFNTMHRFILYRHIINNERTVQSFNFA